MVLTVRFASVAGKAENLALTDLFAVNRNLQSAVPVQAPVHPAKKKPVAGVAVSVTSLPPGKEAAQVVPQSMPAGSLLTTPLPFRVTVT